MMLPDLILNGLNPMQCPLTDIDVMSLEIGRHTGTCMYALGKHVYNVIYLNSHPKIIILKEVGYKYYIWS